MCTIQIIRDSPFVRIDALHMHKMFIFHVGRCCVSSQPAPPHRAPGAAAGARAASRDPRIASLVSSEYTELYSSAVRTLELRQHRRLPYAYNAPGKAFTATGLSERKQAATSTVHRECGYYAMRCAARNARCPPPPVLPASSPVVASRRGRRREPLS